MISFSKTFKSSIAVISLLSAAGLSLTQTANANPFGTSSGGKPQVAEEPEFHYQQLKRYEQLPDVPQYTGQAEFIQGVLYPSARGGKSISYSLAARENRELVIRWYQDALKMYKWNMDGEQTPSNIHGMKGGNFVQVVVAPASKAGYGCDILITYRTAGQ